MGKVYNRFNSISCRPNIIVREDLKREIHYILNEESKAPIDFIVKLPYYSRPEISYEIINCSDKYRNGFKVVETANGEYAYVRESDGKLLPYRYDIASDFNKYGFAMVGKDGSVTWINKNFQYLSYFGNMVEEQLDDENYKYRKLEGFEKVYKFSKGSNPLSRVYEGRKTRGITSYFGTDGKIKKFYEYNGKLSKSLFSICFYDNVDFGKNNYIINGDKILFSEGYYCPASYIINLYMQNGTLESLVEDVHNHVNKAPTKKLKK